MADSQLMEIKRGAGVIPFAVHNGSVWFLFHRTFSGRRAGLLVDFGGGSRAGEPLSATAAREFVEETDTMFFASDYPIDPAAVFTSQYQLMLQLIERTRGHHPEWFCQRKSSPDKPRQWKTFFVAVEYRDPAGMNAAWANDTSGRFKKRRELLWLSADQLLDIIDNRPELLWRRIRKYQGLRDIVQMIARQ